MCVLNNFPKLRFGCVCLLIILLTVVFVLNQLGNNPPLEVKGRTIGEPIITDEPITLTAEITQLLDNSNNLYVLFGKIGVVQVFSIDGEYQYSIGMYSHQNGRFRIALNDGYLNICDKAGNIYVFDGAVLLAYVNREDVTQNIDFYCHSTNFQVSGSSVWQTYGSGPDVCVIRRPLWQIIYQGGLGNVLFFVLLLITGMVLLHKQKDKL